MTPIASTHDAGKEDVSKHDACRHDSPCVPASRTMRKLGWLAGTTLLLWALAIYPGWLLGGELVWPQSLTALGLCLVPALISLAWSVSADEAPEKQLLAILGGTGIRMALALGGSLLLYKTWPATFTDTFWLWMVLFYMFILAMETILVVRKKRT